MTDDDLDTNYARAYDNRLGFGAKPALLLVDLVLAYFDDTCPLYAGVEAELASALRLRDAARAANVPVIYTNVVYHASMVDGGRFAQKVLPLECFSAGNPLGRFADGLAPAPGELVISKQYPSAFFATSLASTLTTQGIDSVIIAGLTTSGCVRATCVDAISHGFIPLVVADACGDRHEAPHRANLFDMQAKYADVIDEATAINYLRALSP